MTKYLDIIAKKYYFSVEDTGKFYEIVFTDRITKEKIHFITMGELIYFEDIIILEDGRNPADLTKNDWVELYLKAIKK